MKKITVENIEDGMTLGREVCGSAGNILLTKGTVLSVALGRRLKNWGIPVVYIEGDEEILEPGTTLSVSPEELKEQLMSRFGEALNNPIMKKLFVAIYQYKLQNAANRT